jgi:predicted HicB family RNase H-like nuclease
VSAKEPKEKRGKRELRDANLLVRLQPAEKKAFQDAANLSGIPLSAWIRQHLRNAAIRELREKAGAIPEFLKEITSQLK